MANTRRKSRSDRFIFLGCSMVTAVIKLKTLTPWRESYGKPIQHINKTETLLVDQVPYRKTMVFPVDMYRCESWTIRKAEGQRINVFELWCWRRFLRVPWTVNEIKPKGNQLWLFMGRTDTEDEAPIPWPPYVKSTSCKRPWCWERLKAKGEGDGRGIDG